VAIPIEAATVRTLSGEAVRLRDFWKDRPAVVALLRHFG
jgi:hypothetical protein